MKIFKLIMIMCFSVMGCALTQGQIYTPTTDNKIHFFGIIVDSITKEPLPGAVIYQITEEKFRKLTQFTVADKNGKFQFETPKYFSTRVEISCVGYKVRKFVLPKDHQTMNMGKVWLAPDIQKLDEVTVSARAKMYKQFGDTTRIYARSVKTLKGDAIIEILRQIPGIKVNQYGSVSMDGKPIEYTLLNGKLIFGDDKITALYTIDADQAMSIDIYDEEIESATSFKKQKSTVMNIRTKKDFNRYFTVEALLEGGQNHIKHENGNDPKIYNLNGKLGTFQEGFQAQLNTMKSNFMGQQDRYNQVLKNEMPRKQEYIRGKLVREFGDFNNYLRDHYSITGSYSKDKNQYIIRKENTYFPTEDFESQLANNENKQTSANTIYNVAVDGNYTSTPNIKAHFSGLFMSKDSDQSRVNQSETFRNGTLLTTTHNRINSEINHAYSSSYLNFAYKLNKKNFMHINLGINHEKPKRTESHDLEIMNSELETHTTLGVKNNSPHTDLSSSLHVTHLFDTSIVSGHSISLQIETLHKKAKINNTAVDKQTGLIDDIYSENYEMNTQTLSSGLEFIHKIPGRSITSRITFNHIAMNRDERIPEKYVIRKTFNTWSPFINITWEGEKRGNISLTFSISQQIPHVKFFSNILNISNPMFPQTGNPDLDPVKEYNFSMKHRLSSVKKQISLNTEVRLKYYTDNVVYKRQYFKNNTILPEYDSYEFPAGSTLISPINGNDYWDLKISSSIQKQINYLGRLETIVGYTFRDPQSEVAGRLVRQQEHKGTFNIKLATNFSRHIRLNLSNSTSYLWNQNSEKYKERGIQNKATVHLLLNFLQYANFESGYIMDYYNPSVSNTKINSHLLNAMLGYRIFKKRKGLISLNAFNILDKNTNFKTSVSDQFISNSWDRLFERYYTISFEYKFNSQK